MRPVAATVQTMTPHTGNFIFYHAEVRVILRACRAYRIKQHNTYGSDSDGEAHCISNDSRFVH
jgi:hypothetical protein